MGPIGHFGMAFAARPLAAGIAYQFLRDRRASRMLGLVVLSHCILDFIVHPPDLPILFDASQAFRLGLWTTGPGLILSIILKFALLVGGLMVYIFWRKKK